jgi:predicted transport protein
VQVGDAVEKALATAAKLKASSAANEANTKVLLIEPLLAALGWDTGDLDAVEREYRVYDNTSLDYALKIDGKPRLFVEAKGIGKNLDDKQFIAQTVNYANNEGVLWCVLTNGLVYRVYKTNEPVPMEQKLLFEVDLSAEGTATAEKAKSLELIARPSMVNDALENWGDRVFTDARVRKALAQLAAQPSTKFMNELNDLLGKPEISSAKLRESLARVMDAESLAAPKSNITDVGHKPKPPTGAPPKGGKDYSVERHLAGKSAAILDSFEQLDKFGREQGADVTRRIRKQYIGYFAGKKSFFTIEVQRQRLLLYLNLDPTTVQPWDESTMRDVKNIGQFGMGNTEYSVKQATDLDGARALIKKAYAATSA